MDLLDLEVHVERGLFGHGIDAARHPGGRLVQHIRIGVKVGECFLAGLRHVGEIGDRGLQVPRGDRVACLDARREKAHRAVVRFDRIEAEWKQFLQPLIPVLLLARLRVLLRIALYQVQFRRQERHRGDQSSVHQAAPLDREIHTLRLEERDRVRASYLLDLHVVDAVRAAPQVDVDIPDVAAIRIERCELVIDVALHAEGERQPHADQQHDDHREGDEPHCSPRHGHAATVRPRNRRCHRPQATLNVGLRSHDAPTILTPRFR